MDDAGALDRLLGQLGAELGLPGLAFDAAGRCRLALDELVLELERTRDGGALFLVCLVGELPETGRAAAMARLLDANFLFKGTGGATLGVAEGSSVVALAYRAPAAGLGLVQLRALLEGLAAAGEHARGLLEEQGPAPAAAAAAPFLIRG